MHGLSMIWFVNQVPDLSFFFFLAGGVLSMYHLFLYVPLVDLLLNFNVLMF